MGHHTETQHFSDSSDADALDWARRHSGLEQVEPVSDWPWARTLRLVGAGPAAHLNVVPASQAHVIAPQVALATHFPSLLPRVLAHDTARGWLLAADHGGRTLDYEADNDELLAVVRAYATMQAAAADPGVLATVRAGLADLQVESLVQRLLDFLRPDDAQGAGFYLGAETASTYRELLERRGDLLQQHLQAARMLPPTICQGDLRPPNVAVIENGASVIVGWHDVIVGPAGTSLHGLFSGSVLPTVLLSGSSAAQAAAATPKGQLIHAYVDTLSAGGYADRATLLQALPAAMCAGQMQFMLNFAAFLHPDNREDVADTLISRLEDLLDVCDWLATQPGAPAELALALAYGDIAQGEDARARKLLQDHTLRHPQDIGAALQLGHCLLRLDEAEQAEQTFNEALARTTQQHHSALQAGLATVQLSALRLEEAASSLALANHAGADTDTDAATAASVPALRRRVHDMLAMQAAADEPSRMPVLRYDTADREAGKAPPELLALGEQLFERHGTLQIDNVFAPEAIAALHDLFIERYGAYFRDDDHPDALRLGDKRCMLTVDMDGPLGAAALVGAPMVLPLIRRVLGEDCVLGAYTAVISLPGSADQRLHKDHPALYPGTPWQHTLPCFAAQIIIPLVPLDEYTGTTRFYKGTHRRPTDDAEAMGAQDPLVPLGSCILNDYRCAHRGLGNRSDRVRPILTLIFNRPWFRDYRNYAQQPPLRIGEAAHAALPQDVQSLLDWWMEERRNDKLTRALLRV